MKLPYTKITFPIFFVVLSLLYICSCSKVCSFRSHNYPGFYIATYNFDGVIKSVDNELERKEAIFRMVPGLANRRMISIESCYYPGYYLRHSNFQIKLELFSSDKGFKKDATFKVVKGLADPEGISFESYNYPGFYIRHKNFKLYISEITDELSRQDATFYIIYR